VINIAELLNTLSGTECSDLHVAAGMPPYFRLNGAMVPAAGVKELSPGEVERMIFQLLSQEQQGQLHREGELDFSFSLPNIGRYRGNIHRQRGTWAAAFRKIPASVPSFTELGLPEATTTFSKRESGLVLVTGPTGAGKSMTLASIVQAINEARPCHIITIEDPIEVLFRNAKAIVKQREIGTDTRDFATALRHVFRQDPDVIMIGELRDHETLSMAITCAATGRLVLGTLHTTDAASTVNRIVESFPAEQQAFIQAQVAGCLEGVISQRLLLRADGKSRILATEVLVSNAATRNLIRTGKSFQLLSDIEVGKKQGMHSMNQSLHELVVNGDVKLEEALRHTRYPDALLQRVGVPKAA
jgi:twitching motility protein PilT